MLVSGNPEPEQLRRRLLQYMSRVDIAVDIPDAASLDEILFALLTLQNG